MISLITVARDFHRAIAEGLDLALALLQPHREVRIKPGSDQ